MSNQGRFWKILLPLLILIGGALTMVLMIKNRPAPDRQDVPFRGLLVETISVKPVNYPLRVRATGTVQARQKIDIVPQVSGMVTEVGANLATGGFVKAGELLFAVEQVDFQLAVDRAQAGLTKAELDLETAQARAQIALEEWDQLHPGEEPSPLASYQPQLKSAGAAVASARASLRQAQLDLQRTRITAPFNGYLRSENVDIGQYLRAGSVVASLVGTDAAEIIVPLPVTELQWLDIPRHAGRRGSRAEIALTAGSSATWQGWVDRALGEVDPQGRMARLAVLVEDPYGLNQKRAPSLPLAVGSFVGLSLEGNDIPLVVELPRRALREGDSVWVMDAENRLRIRQVGVLRRERDLVLIRDGLQEGEKVIVSAVGGAADGLLLRQAAE